MCVSTCAALFRPGNFFVDMVFPWVCSCSQSPVPKRTLNVLEDAVEASTAEISSVVMSDNASHGFSKHGMPKCKTVDSVDMKICSVCRPTVITKTG